MIHFKLIREPYNNKDYTRGELFDMDTNDFLCYTLEDRLRNINDAKVYGKTCIPFDYYTGFLRLSPKRGRIVPQLDKVKKFKYVQIHSGTTVDDTDGCILVGLMRFEDKIWQSRKAEKMLVDKIEKDGGKFELKIC